MQTQAAMLSRSTDALLIGGAATFLFFLAHFAIDKGASTNSVSWFTYYLSFGVNYPHFLASYLLFYNDNGHRWREPKFLVAGIAVPAILTGFMTFSFVSANPKIMATLTNVMFFLVGWHYVKQIYGTVIVSAAVHRYFMLPWQKNLVRFSLYAIWGLSLVAAQRGSTHSYLGISYTSLHLPYWAFIVTAVFTGIGAALVIGMVVVKYVQEGVLPPLSSTLSYAVIYLWYIPAFSHPVYFYVIPFFHSLQYILFVLVLKHNESIAKAGGLSAPSQRSAYLYRFGGFILASIVLGAMAFVYAPNFLDDYFPAPTALGSQAYLFAFTIFINIHHYFIDSVIWTKDNPDIAQFIVKPSQV